MAARGVHSGARRALLARAHGASVSQSSARAARTALALQLPLEDVQNSAQWAALAAMAVGGAALATVALSDRQASCDAKHAVIPSVSLPGGDADALGSSLVGEEEPAKPKRRHLLKSRTRHKAKLEEVDLMKIHLDEYKKARAAIDSLNARFEMYATKTIEGTTTPAMTFTDFVHSLILPRFHTRLPHPDIEYSCDFVGNTNGLITFEECYLLIHLLQIPKEHFDVAFCMFDLDGDGAVDKDEFCHVIENLLRAIGSKENEKAEIKISADETLPRLIKYLFGGFGKKHIRAVELEAVLDVLRKQILKAEFDLYAKPHPSKKGVQVISVHDFAITLLSFFDPDRLPPFLERVERLNASDELVTWDDFYNFHFHVQSNLADIKLAFELTGTEEITEADFIRAAHVVTGVELPFPVVQLAFRVFDSNDNGTLDHMELMKVLETRSTVDLKKRAGDSKLQRFWHCAKGDDE